LHQTIGAPHDPLHPLAPLALLSHASVFVPMTASTRVSPKSLANLTRRWEAGESGNPAGRPPALVDIAALARVHGPKCIEVAAKLLDSDDERIRLAAVIALLDRGFGKPPQSVTDATTGEKVTFLHLIAARSISDQINGDRVFEAEHTDVDTAPNAPSNLLEPALE
jgi:hypothetical protein